jgi:D-alanyl-D-alanine carboxypeptidase (penicillin-binding protein 5/6)
MHEFVCYMNEKCHRLKMYKTRFSNPHGLDMLNNYSCCDDVLLLANEAMLHPDLRKIVKTHTYKGTFKFFREGKVVCKPAHWTNTNKLLSRPNVIGLKTGVTSKAGGCLATAFVSKSG